MWKATCTMVAAGRASLEGFSVDNKVKVNGEMGKEQWALNSTHWPWPGATLSQKSYSGTRASGTLLSLVSTLCQPPLQWNKNTGQRDDSPGKGAWRQAWESESPVRNQYWPPNVWHGICIHTNTLNKQLNLLPYSIPPAAIVTSPF